MNRNDWEKFSETGFARPDFVPPDRGVYLQHHIPRVPRETYHLHPSVEVNFLQNCEMTYSFSGTDVKVPEGRFCVFWAAIPHGAKKIDGSGTITNVYVTLSELLRWSLPQKFVSELLGGSLIASKSELPGDRLLADQWAAEVDQISQEWQRLHALEVRSRLLRLAFQGWDTLAISSDNEAIGGISERAVESFEKMLRFIALHYTDKIYLADVANAGGVSQNYAIILFRRLLGSTVKNYISELRIIHAKMQLINSESKILTVAMDCGFGSQAAFYDVFQKYTGVSPAVFRESARDKKMAP